MMDTDVAVGRLAEDDASDRRGTVADDFDIEEFFRMRDYCGESGGENLTDATSPSFVSDEGSVVEEDLFLHGTPTASINDDERHVSSLGETDDSSSADSPWDSDTPMTDDMGDVPVPQSVIFLHRDNLFPAYAPEIPDPVSPSGSTSSSSFPSSSPSHHYSEVSTPSSDIMSPPSTGQPPASPVPTHVSLSPPLTFFSRTAAIPATIKKSRTLPHPEETVAVRQRGACYCCKIRRIKCDPHLVCSQCEKECKKLKSPHASRVCIRIEPSRALGAHFYRWIWTEHRSQPSREKFRNTPCDRGRIWISLTDDRVMAPCLELCVARVNKQSGNQADPNWAIAPDMCPREDTLCAWADSQMMFENRQCFEGHVERLLRRYCEVGCLEKVASLERNPLNYKHQSFVKTQKSLMQNVCRMTCMFRVWRAPNLYVRRSPDSLEAHSIGRNQHAIEEQLRLCASQCISVLERNILGQIDEFLNQSSIQPREHPLLWAAAHVAVWMTLVQMMLFYRRTLHLSRQPGVGWSAGTSSTLEFNQKRRSFAQGTEQLFNGIVVIYSELFRTSNSMGILRLPSAEVFAYDEDLCRLYRRTWEKRKQFYQEVGDVAGADELFRLHVIIKEGKVFGRKRPTRPKILA